jgi:uncharacterized repeat protein (TIGR02543 family)
MSGYTYAPTHPGATALTISQGADGTMTQTVMDDNSVAFNLYYTVNTYTVGYELDNAAYQVGSKYAGTFTFGQAMHIAPQATKSGYTTTPWALPKGVTANGQGQYSMPAANIIFKASSKYDPTNSKWLRITYYANDGKFSNGATSYRDPATYQAGDVATIQFNVVPTRSGYDFKGWVNAAGHKFNNTDTIIDHFKIAANTTFYADWGKSKNGGNGNGGGSHPQIIVEPPAGGNTTPTPSSKTTNGTASQNTPTGPLEGLVNSLTDGQVPTASIGGHDVPLININGGGWAIINLLLALIGLVWALLLCLVYPLRRRKDDQRTTIGERDQASSNDAGRKSTRKGGLLWRLLGLVVALASSVAFVLTENVLLQPILIDSWTLLMVGLIVLEALFSVIALVVERQRGKGADDEDPLTAQEPGVVAAA